MAIPTRIEDPCAQCPLRTNPLHPASNPDARFLVVSKQIKTHEQVRDRRTMHPSALKMFADRLSEDGFSRQDFVFTNSVRCAYEPTEWRATDKKIIEKSCREHLLRLIETMNPEVIIPLGADAAKAVSGRPVKITKVRGVPSFSEEHQCVVLPMSDPGYVFINPQHEPIFNSDVKVLRRIVDHGYDLDAAAQENENRYEVVTDLQFLIDEKPKYLAFDAETTGFRWQYEDSKILIMQLCPEPGRAYVIPWDHSGHPLGLRQKQKLKGQLKQLLQNPEISVVGQNGKFDLLWVWECLGFRFRLDHDTLMIAAEIDENLQNKDLDTLTKIYAPEMAGYADWFNSRYDKSRMDLVPFGELVQYGCLDYDSFVQLWDGTWEKIGRLVEDRYCGNVMSVTEAGEVVSKPVIGWWDNGTTHDWYRVILTGAKFGRDGVLGPRFTGDHEMYTDRGIIPVIDIVPGDRVLTTEAAYTTDQLQILYGSLLGDGGYSTRNNAGSGLRLGQAIERGEYARWKADILMPSGYSVQETERAWRAQAAYSFRDAYYAKWAASCGFRSKAKTLRPTEEVLSLLDYLGIATWYSDDGTFVTSASSCRIYCKDDEEGPGAARWFSALLGHKVTYLESQGAICFSKQATNALHSEIAKYMHPCVRYKLLPTYRTEEFYSVDTDGGLFYAPVEEVRKVKPARPRHDKPLAIRRVETRYCLTVEGTHNFVTQAGVVRNCGDTDATMRVFLATAPLVYQDEKMWAHYRRVAMPGINAFAAIERRGALIDEQALDDFEVVLDSYVAKLKRELMAQVPRSIKRAHVEKGMEFSRPAFVIDILFNHPDGFRLTPRVFTDSTEKLANEFKVPSVSTKDHLPYFFDHKKAGDFCIKLADYIKNERLLNVNVRKYREKYIIGGSVYTSYSLWTAVTGRSASSNPNSQNEVTRGVNAKAYKRIFSAPPGHVMISCVPEGTRVSTGSGLCKIEDILVGDSVYGLDGELHKVTAAGKTGEDRVVNRITTACGRYLDATPDHRVCVVRGSEMLWDEQVNVMPGDFLVSLDKPICGGKEIDLDLAYWVGYFMGDGCYSHGRGVTLFKGRTYVVNQCSLGFALGSDADELAPRLNAFFNRYSRNVSIRSASHKGDVKIHDEGLVKDWKKRFPKNGSKDMHVPGEIWESGLEGRRAYLSGAFDSDGSAHSRRLTITSVCEQYIDELLELGASIGVFGVKRKQKIERGFFTNTEFAYNMDVFGASSISRFPDSRIARKQERIVEFRGKGFTQCRTEFVPFPLLEPYHVRGAQVTAEGNRLFGNGRRNNRVTRDAIRTACESNAAIEAHELLPYRYTEVVSNERLCIADVYDITVENAHSFVAKGFIIHNCDLSQAELRVIGDMANDRTMIEIYQRGEDIHKHTACIALGITMEQFNRLPKEEQKLARFKSKAINFGYVFGMSYRKFITYAKTQYGIEFTEREARRIRDGFFGRYSNIEPYHQTMIEFARQHGYVRSYSGFVRHLPAVWSEDRGVAAEAERQSINSPVQGFASDLGVMALSRIDQEVNPEYLRIVKFVHDAIYAYVLEEYVEWGARTLKYYMESNPLQDWFGRRMKIPIIADVSFGWNGGDQYEMGDISENEPYDFEALALNEKTGELDFVLPPQLIPPNNGRIEQPEHLIIHI